MEGAGVQYLIVIEMVVRMEKECKNTNEEENMKKNVKKVISFILSMLVIISTAVTPAMAAGTKEAPTEVKSVMASGLWTTVLNLEFEDTTWMDNINKVIVNDKECKKSMINSFSSDTSIWEVGSATGAYGSYKALKLAVPDGKLWTVKVSADGYKDLTVKITKETVNYTDTYKAEVVSNSGETTNKRWKRVKANKGSSGVDGIRIEDIEEMGIEKYLSEIKSELMDGKYKPSPVKRVMIPKPDGSERPLGIPTVKDRIVQMATKIAIEPVFEADFRDCSYGFRPKRSAKQALEVVRKACNNKGYYVVDADIEKFFDNVNQDKLMKLVEQRISDRRILKLIR